MTETRLSRRSGLVPLDRALSKLGLSSRASARQQILDGRVSVAGATVRDPARLVHPESADIRIDDVRRARAAWRTIVLHKPRGVVTTRRDPDGRRTVFDVLGEEAGALVAVGRLDLATSGLLILTTDTRLADWLTDPANAIVRRYLVSVRGLLTDDEAARMTAGIGGSKARSVHVRKRSRKESHLVVDLDEGRNREIRRLCEAVQHPVTALKRVAFGSLELGTLRPGQWRDVSREELARTVGPATPRRSR
jgi:23S rRNA pseudouridine2605 synthase